ncbi:MAG TPA: hypothetical protein VER58_10320 [Thermoanaerobaculia bacterium]|nr:hypothetical protein [Thermoanaerobaculia bacterium]
MAISDEEVVQQLESVPQVEPPDMRGAVIGKLRAPHPARGRRHLLVSLAWAAAVVIVVSVAYIERNSLPWEHTEATMAPLPFDHWKVVTRIGVPQEGRLTVRRNGDQFAIQPYAFNGEPISVAWDQKKLDMSDVLSDTSGPEVVILHKKSGASGWAVIQLNIGGHEVLKTAISID